MTSKGILVIDDNDGLCEVVRLVLEDTGAEIYTAQSGRDGLRRFFEERPDLVILDIMLPDISGWEVCKQIRLLADTPILLLTTLDEDEAVVRGLDLGADDFLSKPFNMDVLVARSRALLRRASSTPEPKQSFTYSDEYLTVDLQKHRVLVRGEPVKLTATEFELLSYLVRNAGRVLTYAQILERVWGPEYCDSPDYVHVYLSHLRRKLEEDPRQPRYLVTEHGVGYRFERALAFA
ncbi:MAG: response regulator transcription factor [Candidatus Promineifilaceae bacterium]|nr:response regulator transcription factor [Candidatus Promineifilaceae bacterium]